MKNPLKTLSVVLPIIFGISTFCFGQYTSVSENAYHAWKDRQNLLGSVIPKDHLGIGFAASKYQEIGISVDISVFAGTDLYQLPKLEFVVQPLQVTKELNGKISVEDVGDPATIKSSHITISPTESSAVTQQEIIIRSPKNATAVRIVIKGFGNIGQEFSVVLPIEQKPSTAVLAKSFRCNSSNLSECQWFTGTCESSCPGMMCVACNNGSPSLNCVNCTMGCGGGGTGSNCTPTVERPEGCPQT